MMLRLIPLIMLMILTACSPRGEFVGLDELSREKAEVALTQSTREVVFVGTSRRAVDGQFGYARSEAASFLRYDIAVPPGHAAGDVKWPRSAASADPETDFLTLTDQSYANADDFRKALRQEMHISGTDEVVVYVHGFNNTMAESVYRVAQLHNDLNIEGVAVHYAWPSRGSALAYVYDRDSALFGRDALESLLQQVARAGAKRIVIVGHSMGGALVMETLRQSAIRNDGTVLNRLGGVILLSPDLDVDLFRAQARAMGKLPQPFVIFGSSRDSVLNLSAKLSGAPDRLGNLTDLTVLEGLEVTYLDTAAYDVGGGHFNVGNSPALIALLGGVANLDAAFRAEAAARVGLLPGIVLTLRGATGIILAPVEDLATPD